MEYTERGQTPLAPFLERPTMKDTLHNDSRLEAIEAMSILQKEIASTIKDFDFHSAEMLRAEKKLKTLHDTLRLHKEIWT